MTKSLLNLTAMKKALLTIIVGCLVSTAFAASNLTIRTTDGTVLSNARIMRISLQGITISHSGGVSTYLPDQLEGVPLEITEKFTAAKKSAARLQADIEKGRLQINALRQRIGKLTPFFVKRKLKHKDFPSVADSPLHDLYEILIQGRELAILETRTTEFFSHGQATLFLIPKTEIAVELATGFTRVIPVFLEANPKDIKELQYLLAEMPCAECKATGRCPKCLGQKVVRCKTCLGTGRGNQYQKKVKCPSCHGAGFYISRFQSRVGCTQCSRSGYLNNTEIPPCAHCEGRSVLICPKCSGTGLCPACQGKGKGAKKI